MKLSVIIPVYNVEATLERCLHSVIAQGVGDMEVILVDDGSTDGSSEIARRMAEENSLLRYFRQENAGLSAARNTGIRNAMGDYITFVDSDDYLVEGTYKALLQMLEKREDCDILEYSLVKTNSGDDTPLPFPDATYTDARTYWLEGKAYSHTYACNKLFRRKLFALDSETPLLFKEGIVFEDAEFMSRLLQGNPRVVTTSQMGYVYEWNPKGITGTADGQKLASLLETNLYAARLFGMSFMQPQNLRKTVPSEESAFYLSLLNIQISVCQQTHSTPILPDCKVTLSQAYSIVMLLKVLVLNILGINRLCRILS